MKKIPLTRGMFALVDDEDYEELSKYRWCAVRSRNTYYALRNSHRDVNGKQYNILMHRVIIGTPIGMETDHIDGDGLNNQRYNLRICTKQENQRNRRNPSNNTSGYKGVSFRNRTGRWQARIDINGKTTHLGMFSTPEEAHSAYCEAAKKYYGDFANTG